MNSYTFFSYILVVMSVTYLYLVVKRHWWSWMLGFPAQIAFGLYSALTHQFAFLVAAFAYTWVCYQDFRQWKNNGSQKVS